MRKLSSIERKGGRSGLTGVTSVMEGGTVGCSTRPEDQERRPSLWQGKVKETGHKPGSSVVPRAQHSPVGHRGTTPYFGGSAQRHFEYVADWRAASEVVLTGGTGLQG